MPPTHTSNTYILLFCLLTSLFSVIRATFNLTLPHQHPNPEAVVQEVQRRLNVSIYRRQMVDTGGGCLTGNPIDDCWRCDPNWSNKRQRLADCAIGFGKSAFGGKGGKIYVITDSSDHDVVNPTPGTLRHAVLQTEPLWIVFSSNMVIKLKHELIVNSYKTIDGRGANVAITGGGCITIQYVSNIIIHNIRVYDCKPSGNVNIRSSPTHVGFRGKSDGDGISISGSRNIWIDHCSLSHCTDGLIDAVLGSTGITISNSYFTHHNEVMLMGHDDGYMPDKGMQVTFAFNHFGRGLIQRMPRCRHGYFHVVNNDFTEWKMYAIGGSADPTINSQGNRYIAPPNADSKEVTKRVDTDEGSWSGWNWRTDGDIMVNGAFFVPSGDGLSAIYAKASSYEAKSAAMVTQLTKYAGVFGGPRAPVQVIEALERIRRNFFWGGTSDIDKLSWMAWEKVVSPPKFGGVGLGALRESNLSLLSKWWWRFKTNQNGLWRKVVWAIHGSSRGWYCIPVKLSLGGTWKQIASIPKLLGNYHLEPHKLIKASVKSGNDICFWLDWWIGDDILQNLFPLLYGLEKNKCCLVSDRIRTVLQVTQLSWEWRRAVFSAQELVQMADLQQLLSGVSVSVGLDSWAAKTDGSGSFAVSAVKQRMLEAMYTVPADVYQWCNWVPKKVGIVAWRALYNRLPTIDALLRRNIQVTNVRCCLCDTNNESVEHLFTGCPVALEIWPHVFSWCRVPNLFAFHVRDLLLYYKTAKTNDRARKAFYGVVLTTFWSLWKARNDLLHNQKPVVVRNVFEEIKIMSYLWITNRGKMSDMTWDSWGRFDSTKMG